MKSDVAQRVRILRGTISVSVLAIAFSIGIAPSAFAQSNVLFSGTISRIDAVGNVGTGGTASTMATVFTPANPLGGQVNNVGHIPTTAPLALVLNPVGTGSTPRIAAPGSRMGTPRSFAIGAKAFNFAIHFTTGPFPGYPLLIADAVRYNKAAGPFYAGAEIPGTPGIRTADATNSQYPFRTLTPAVAKIVVKPGPNGFGGPLPIVQLSDYYGTKSGVGGTGSSDFIFKFADIGGTWGSLPTQNKRAGYSFATNIQTPSVMAGAVAKHHPAVWAITGTITASEPLGGYATVNIKTGMDSRNAAGTMGPIQLVSSRIFSSYVITPSPPPLDESGTATLFRGGTARIYKTALQMAPEPGSAALIGVGAMGLFGMGLRRRSRR